MLTGARLMVVGRGCISICNWPLKKPLLTTKEAFAVRKNNQEILNFLNAWIIAHEADGWIDSSHKYWFNSLKWQRQVAEEK